MNLTARLILTCVMAACAAPCLAQAGNKETAPQPTPDLSGTWVLDEGESYVDSPVRAHLRYAKYVVEIAQRGPEIKIRVEAVRKGGVRRLLDATYYSDGRGEENQVFVARGAKSHRLMVVESKTGWKGTRLLVEGREKEVVGDGGFGREFADTWELSRDGQTLRQTTKSRLVDRAGAPQMGQHDVKRVYRRSH